MSRRSVIVGKSPLHASALRLKDLKPGMRVISFNLAYGISGEFTVESLPFAGYPIGDAASDAYPLPHLMILLRERDLAREHFLADLGVVQYGHGWWNERNFLISASKQDLLPPPDRSLKDDIDDDGDWDYDDWDSYAASLYC